MAASKCEDKNERSETYTPSGRLGRVLILGFLVLRRGVSVNRFSIGKEDSTV